MKTAIKQLQLNYDCQWIKIDVLKTDFMLFLWPIKCEHLQNTQYSGAVEVRLGKKNKYF